MSELDLAIVGGEVIDGTGAPRVRADVGIRGGRIVRVGDLGGRRAARVFDASGRVACPGFIDTHGHSEFGIFAHPAAESHIAQGITTEISGNCGGGPFPVTEASRRLHFFPSDVDVAWSDAAGYFDALDALRPAMNVAALLGHGALRAAVVGLEERPSTAPELERMRRGLRDALAAGALGLSFGGHFVPSMYAERAELAALAEELAAADGVFAWHLRDYGAGLLASIDEAIAIARVTGVRTHLSLLKPYGRAHWGQAVAGLRRLDAARDSGIEITTDTMAYRTAGAWWGPRAVFPEDVYDWRRDDLEGLIRRLRTPDERARLAPLVEQRRSMAKHGFQEEYLIFSDWRDLVIEDSRGNGPNADVIGRSIAEVAAERGVRPVDAFFDLVVAEGRDLAVVHSQVSEEDHRAVLVDPFATLGIDGIATTPDGIGARVDRMQQHPRHWGSFPQVLGHYVRELGVLPIVEAVRKMTSLPARIFRLNDRGVLSEGAHADVVVFDPSKVGAGGTWREPVRFPKGIELVLVNGVAAVEGGRPTGARGGRPVRHGAGVRT